MPHNPTWTREELILTLDVYMRGGQRFLSDRHPDVIALSELLRGLPLHSPSTRTPTFRNPAGVSMKIGNIMAFDPAATASLPAGGRGDRAVWEEFGHRPDELRRVAAAIRASAELLRADGVVTVDEDDEGVAEGRLLLAVHRRRERERGLAARKIARVLRDTGRLECEVCGFDYAQVYGYHGTGFAEVHHRRPLGEVGEGRTRLADLAVVCANCHRMIHRVRPALTVEALRGIVLGLNQ